MEVITLTHNFKLLTLSVAIAISTANLTPVHAEKSPQEVPEIGWSSRVSSMGLDAKNNVGKKYQFNCQPASEDLVHAPVWGSEVYTVNSGICSTAVHSGMLDPEAGGKITIKLVKGKKFYTGSKHNDVTSEDHMETDVSFVFIGEKVAVKEESEDKPSEKKREPSPFEKVLMDGFQRGVERSIEKAIIDILK
jgi:hypothetical protein